MLEKGDTNGLWRRQESYKQSLVIYFNCSISSALRTITARKMHQPKAQEYIPVPYHPPLPLFLKHLFKMWGSEAPKSSGASVMGARISRAGDLENKPGTGLQQLAVLRSSGTGVPWQTGERESMQAPSETLCKEGLVCNMLWLEQSPAVGRIPVRCR